jgi:RHS repeat-associated protein
LDVNGVITDQNADANQAWSLDPVGNPLGGPKGWSQFKWDDDGDGQGPELTQDRAHNKANEIAGNGGDPISGAGAANWVDPTYDPAGNPLGGPSGMISGPQPRYETADANTQLYKYDAWNRLTKIYQDANCNDTIDDPSELVATYSYDGQNRRIRKVLAVPNPDVTYDYYYNESHGLRSLGEAGWQVLEVRKDADADPLEQYVWGLNYIDVPVVRFYDGDQDGTVDPEDEDDNTLYYMYDAQFNVTGLIEPDGDVVERYMYDPYGKVTVLNGASGADKDGQVTEWTEDAGGSDWDNEVLYCGYRYDPESGLYQVRYRYHHPTLARWVSRDPAGYADGCNLLAYTGCNPLGRIDPSGLLNTLLVGLGPSYMTLNQWNNAPWQFRAEIENFPESIVRSSNDVAFYVATMLIPDETEISEVVAAGGGFVVNDRYSRWTVWDCTTNEELNKLWDNDEFHWITNLEVKAGAIGSNYSNYSSHSGGPYEYHRYTNGVKSYGATALDYTVLAARSISGMVERDEQSPKGTTDWKNQCTHGLITTDWTYSVFLNSSLTEHSDTADYKQVFDRLKPTPPPLFADMPETYTPILDKTEYGHKRLIQTDFTPVFRPAFRSGTVSMVLDWNICNGKPSVHVNMWGTFTDYESDYVLRGGHENMKDLSTTLGTQWKNESFAWYSNRYR